MPWGAAGSWQGQARRNTRRARQETHSHSHTTAHVLGNSLRLLGLLLHGHSTLEGGKHTQGMAYKVTHAIEKMSCFYLWHEMLP